MKSSSLTMKHSGKSVREREASESHGMTEGGGSHGTARKKSKKCGIDLIDPGWVGIRGKDQPEFVMDLQRINGIPFWSDWCFDQSQCSSLLHYPISHSALMYLQYLNLENLF